MTAPNPRCTGFCRQGGSRGHPDVPASEVGGMAFAVLSRGSAALACESVPGVIRVALSPQGERDAQDAMRELYAAGKGYHAIADLFGRSHEELHGLAARGFPGTRDPEWGERP